MLIDRKISILKFKMNNKMKTDFTKLSPKKQDESKTVKFTVNEKAGIVVCTLIDRWFGKRFTAKTRVHDVDKWNEKKGRAIAFNKAKRNELLYNIKQCDKELSDMRAYFEELINKIEKRKQLNEVYLAGVNDELNDLMGNPKAELTEEVKF